MSGGTYHTLALTSAGAVYAWGANFVGELGVPVNDPALLQCPRPTTTPVSCSPVPRQVFTVDAQGTPVALSGIKAVAGGTGHTLALKADGTVLAWGNNSNGQLGDGTNSSRPTPAAVSGLTQVKAIAAGDGHSLAVREDGTVWAWGRGMNLGRPCRSGQCLDSNLPVLVPNVLNAVAVAAGRASFAIDGKGTPSTSDDTAVWWG